MLSALRNYAITFFASALIFGLLAYFIGGYAMSATGLDGSSYGDIETSKPIETDTVDTSGGNETSGGRETDAPEINGKSFNFLLIGTDYQPEILSYNYDESNLDENGFPYPQRVASADTIIMIRADKEKGEFLFCAIPGNTEITDRGITKTLGSLYGEEGIEYLSSKVSFLTGMPVDYYAVFTIEGLSAIVDELGGITYYVPAAMYYTDEAQGLEINLSKGTQQLSGKQVLDMLRFNSYSGGSITRISTSVNFVQTMMERYLTPDVKLNIGTYWSKFASHCATNFTDSDLNENLDLIFSYSAFAQTVMSYPGKASENGGETLFEPDVKSAWEMLAPYKLKSN